jgi:hypothetical protein
MDERSKGMFRRSKTDALKENAVSASELALQLAQDKKFRKGLLSALRHSSEAGRRTRRGLGLAGAVSRLATDEGLHAELRSARSDLQRAYARVGAKRRTHRLRKLGLLAGLASLAALPRLRECIASALARTPRNLEDLTKDELYARAQEAEIPGRSEMSKDQLIEALRGRSS